VTGGTLQEFQQRVALLELPDEIRAEMYAELEQGYRLSQVRSGNLPTISVDGIVLDSDELCHV
jgi:hypothetical protein